MPYKLTRLQYKQSEYQTQVQTAKRMDAWINATGTWIPQKLDYPVNTTVVLSAGKQPHNEIMVL